MRRCEDAIVPQPAVRRRPGATVFLSVCTEPAEADRSARTFLPFIFNVYVYSISTHFFYDGEWNSWHLKSCKSYCRLKIPIQFVRLTTRVHPRQPNANSNNSLSTHLVYSPTRKFFLFLLTPTIKFPLFGRFNLYRHIVSLLSRTFIGGCTYISFFPNKSQSYTIWTKLSHCYSREINKSLDRLAFIPFDILCDGTCQCGLKNGNWSGKQLGGIYSVEKLF